MVCHGSTWLNVTQRSSTWLAVAHKTHVWEIVMEHQGQSETSLSVDFNFFLLFLMLRGGRVPLEDSVCTHSTKFDHSSLACSLIRFFSWFLLQMCSYVCHNTSYYGTCSCGWWRRCLTFLFHSKFTHTTFSIFLNVINRNVSLFGSPLPIHDRYFSTSPFLSFLPIIKSSHLYSFFVHHQ